MSKVFIYGAPGAGKSSTSRHLKLLLNYPLIDGDYIRYCIAQLAKSETEAPFLYVGVKEAWRKFGSFSEENVVRGLLAVREANKPFLDTELALYDRNVLMEGPMIDPEYAHYGQAFLVITGDEEAHEAQFFKDRERTPENKQSFKASRIIQSYLQDEAPQYGIEIVHNNDPALLAQELAKRIG